MCKTRGAFLYILVTLSVRKEVVHSYICPHRHIKSPYTQMLMVKMFSWCHKLGGGVWITTSTINCIESFKSLIFFLDLFLLLTVCPAFAPVVLLCIVGFRAFCLQTASCCSQVLNQTVKLWHPIKLKLFIKLRQVIILCTNNPVHTLTRLIIVALK